jgi:hypothetical protein
VKININGITRDMTIEEQAERIQQSAQEQIAALKQQLTDTDYKAIKCSEGLITAEDYAETKAQRQAWREQINVLGG